MGRGGAPPGDSRSITTTQAFLLAGILSGTVPWGAVADAGTLFGRVALEADYLGEAYYSRYELSGLDLGLPSGGSILFTQTTEFSEDTWLGGPRLDLGYHGSVLGRSVLRATSSTKVDSERFYEEAEATLTSAGSGGGRWQLRSLGAIRKDERSVVGDGDWEARIEGLREVPVGRGLTAGALARWDHSRSLGDTTSYLYDYDAGIARLFASGRGVLGRPWEGWLEGAVRGAARGDVGSYTQVRAGGWWRGASPSRELSIDLRYRTYAAADTIGRDGFFAELRGRTRLWEFGRSAFDLEAAGIYTQYPEEDELYVDSVELRGALLWRRPLSGWTLTLGPGIDVYEDLHGDVAAFTEGRLKSGLSRFFPGGGFLDLSLDGGYRKYRVQGSTAVDLGALSSSFLRSDYWLVDLLLAATIPLAGEISLDATVTSSWELHESASERIQITFATLGLGRTF